MAAKFLRFHKRYLDCRTAINLTYFRQISTFPSLAQEPQLEEPASQSQDVQSPESNTVPLPPNPSSGSPLYHENWRSPSAAGLASLISQSLGSLGALQDPSLPSPRMQAFSRTLDLASLMNVFADWMTSQRWSDMKQLFEFWIKSLDKNGKPNKPDVKLYNHYLRACMMIGSTAGELLDLVARMEEYDISPNTASYNLVLKAMYQAREDEAAEKLLDRMLQTGKDSLPDDESYDLVVGLLLIMNKIASAIKYLDMTLKSGYMVSLRVFNECIRVCGYAGRLDTLASIIERCKAMDQNKALCPSWNACMHIADSAIQAGHSKLVFYALEFLARWIARGEMARPPVLLSVDEGLVVSALGTAASTYDSKLVDASWAILQRSLRQKRVPIPEAYLGKICAYASLGNSKRAFGTLRDFETAYDNLLGKTEDLFSPFTSLNPLVVACSKDGFSTLDSVYFQLENLSRADPPYKSVAALNCVILGCANVWDLDRAYQTFEAINGSFGLTPDIHSYNSLMAAFGKLKKTFEAARVFEHMTSVGMKPNSMSYALLVDSHLVNKDVKSALSVIDEMVNIGLVPTKETLRKVKRRCTRELDDTNGGQVEAIVRQFRYRLIGERAEKPAL